MSTLGDFLRKPHVIATRDFVRDVKAALDVDDDLAERIADFCAAEIEKQGGESAQLYFTEDGSGPYCSWCGRVGGLCSHIAGRSGGAT